MDDITTMKYDFGIMWKHKYSLCALIKVCTVPEIVCVNRITTSKANWWIFFYLHFVLLWQCLYAESPVIVVVSIMARPTHPSEEKQHTLNNKSQ